VQEGDRVEEDVAMEEDVAPVQDRLEDRLGGRKKKVSPP